MATEKPQSFASHARFVPVYHGVAFGIFVVNLLWSIYVAMASFSGQAVINLLLALGFLLLFAYARRFPITVQDRVIRLEMRLRLARLLPAEMRSSVDDFTVDQLVAMRFASDGELPDLAREVLAEHLTDRKAIKQLIKNWQPDHLRA
jgi:hypothetical protein